jgi:uncharacterized protein (DUF169 family)
MTLTLDLSIFSKFNFKSPPVGVKFLLLKPEGLVKLDKKIPFCQMTAEAQQSNTPFYAGLENQSCIPANYILGYDIPKGIETGYYGTGLKLFKEPRANRRIYQYITRMTKGIVNYFAFSPLDKLSFDPDLLMILTDDVSQAEIILRALNYTAGQMWTSKMTNVLGCAWLFAYPYMSGEVNYITTGLGFGMIAHEVFPPNKQLFSIPFNWLPTIAQNLQDMPWALPSYTKNREEVLRQIIAEFGFDPFNL